MANPYEYPQNFLQSGDINFSGTLSTVSSSQALTEGTWFLWATEDMHYQVIATSGGSLSANPRAVPKRFPMIVSVGENEVYLRVKAITTSGSWYINKDFHQRGG